MKVLRIVLQVLGVCLAAVGVFALCLHSGEHAAKQCAIDFPHEGQCGLEAMAGASFGFFFGIATLIAGFVTIVVIQVKRNRADKLR